MGTKNQAKPGIFIRSPHQLLLDRLASRTKATSDLHLSLYGPPNSGRKTVLKALVKRRSHLSGRHYLLSGQDPVNEIRIAVPDPNATTLAFLDFSVAQLQEALLRREFCGASSGCLLLWNEPESEESQLPADLRISTSIHLFDEEEGRKLQRAMVDYFLSGMPRAQTFLSRHIEDHDLKWFPAQYHAFRTAVTLLGDRSGKDLLDKALFMVDSATEP